MSAPENPYVYPHVEHGNYSQQHSGMTLRDWFAGQALAALYALQNGEIPGDDLEGQVGTAACWSYAIADAMLAERAKGGAA